MTRGMKVQVSRKKFETSSVATNVKELANGNDVGLLLIQGNVTVTVKVKKVDPMEKVKNQNHAEYEVEAILAERSTSTERGAGTEPALPRFVQSV